MAPIPTLAARTAAPPAAPAPLQVTISEAARLPAHDFTTNGLGGPASGMNARRVGATSAYQPRRGW